MIQKFIATLEAKRAAYARAALEQPRERSEFEYGTHHGVMKGYDDVLNILNKLLIEEEKDDDL